MASLKLIFPVLAALVMAGGQVFSQSDLGSQILCREGDSVLAHPL
jgi:hypothetical protein